MAFNCLLSENARTSEELDEWCKYYEKLVDKINGKPVNLGGKKYTHDKEVIYENNTAILLVRGWGYLEPLLGDDEAGKIQEEFLKFCCEKLNL